MNDLPHIWVGAAISRNATEQCCDDCACVSARSSANAVASLAPADMSAPALFRVVPDAMSTSTADMTAVLAPYGDRVFVFDQAGLGLLAALHHGATIDDLHEAFPEVSEPYLQHLLRLMEAQGLVSRADSDFRPVTLDQPSKLSAWLHLTDECDLACTYCYVKHGCTRMSLPTATAAVHAVLRSAVAHSFDSVRLKYAGGEPTINFEALRTAQTAAEILADESSITLESVLLTNGISLVEEQIQYLLDHKIEVMVSLDGLGPFHNIQRPLVDGGGSCDLVCAGIDRLISAGLLPFVSITLTSANLPGLPHLLQYLARRGIPYSVNFARPVASSSLTVGLPSEEVLVTGLNRALSSLPELSRYSLLSGLIDRADLSAPHVRACSAGLAYFAISQTGLVAKCHMDLDEPVTSINVLDPLGTIMSHPLGLQNPKVDERDCRDCLWRYRCAGGCPRLAPGGKRSPLCSVYLSIMPEVLRLEALRIVHRQHPWGAEDLTQSH